LQRRFMHGRMTAQSGKVPVKRIPDQAYQGVRKMKRSIPPITYLLGAAGLIPFIVCAMGALSAGAWHQRGELALLAYGAVILAFLGGVHWGFVLAPADAPAFAAQTRLALGIVPSLLGWAAVILATLGLAELGLALQILGFAATILVEHRWSSLGLVPPAYMRLRWALSVVVLMTLITVLSLRLIGASVVF
jgi:hypothetical protein